MADTSIFSVQPPEWMQRRADVAFESALQDSKQLGENLGRVAGSAIVAGVNPKDSKQNFLSRWSNAYNEMQDPFYQGKKAAADLQVATLKDRVQGMKEYPEWLKSTGGNAEKMLDTPFTGNSEWASDMVEKAKMQAWQRSTQRQAVEVRQQQVENQLAAAQIKADAEKFANETRAAATKEAARIRAEAQKAVAQTQAQSRTDVQKTAQQFKLDLEKYKADLRQTQGGKSVSKEEFINRQMGRVMTDLYNSWDVKANGKYDARKAADLSQQILADTYDKFATQPAPAPSPTPAKPVKVGGFTVTPVADEASQP